MLCDIIPKFPKCFRKLLGNFTETFLSRDEIVSTEINEMLHHKKYNFTAVKVLLRQIPKSSQGKFPPEKNPPENISDKFNKFRKFFLTGRYCGKKYLQVLITKCNLPTVKKCLFFYSKAT